MMGRCGRGKGETFRQDSKKKGLKVGGQEGKDVKGEVGGTWGESGEMGRKDDKKRRREKVVKNRRTKGGKGCNESERGEL